MIDVICDFLKRNNLSLNNQTIVVAVSTGVDSMTLLSCLNEIKEKENFKIVIAHVNHHKRKQSKEEEEYIKKYAEEKKIECFVKEAYFENTKNFQMVARNVRYDFFYEVLKKVNSKYLFLAHHADDNMETILMRLIRGTSVKGYSGIEDVSTNNGVYILRPFLDISKEAIKEYALKENIKFYEDASNSHLDYTRNRIRHEVIPLLRKEDVNVEKKFSDFSKLILLASKALEEKINNFILENISINKEIHFKKEVLENLPEAFLNEILFTLLKKYNLGKNNIIEIKKLIFSNKANIKQAYKNLFMFVKEYSDVYIYDEFEKKLECNIIIDDAGKYLINDKISICVTEKTDKPLTNLDVLWYNTDMFPLIIRTRRPGDKIYLGNGYRKVKDVLIDEKIGIMKRDQTLLAVDKNDEVLIIFGIKKSTKLKELKNCNVYIWKKEN